MCQYVSVSVSMCQYVSVHISLCQWLSQPVTQSTSDSVIQRISYPIVIVGRAGNVLVSENYWALPKSEPRMYWATRHVFKSIQNLANKRLLKIGIFWKSKFLKISANWDLSIISTDFLCRIQIVFLAQYYFAWLWKVRDILFHFGLSICTYLNFHWINLVILILSHKTRSNYLQICSKKQQTLFK